MLPSELQWECAARFGGGTAKVPSPSHYPWQVEPKVFDNLANIGKKVGEVTVVGLYPQGNSPGGLSDIAGNVWEWMGHRYVGGYDPTRPLMGQKMNDEYSLRGGSCINGSMNARCSYRLSYPPDSWYLDLGFRVVLSLPISGNSGS